MADIETTKTSWRLPQNLSLSHTFHANAPCIIQKVEPESIGRLKVWIRMAEYKAWCDSVDDYGTSFCWKCECNIWEGDTTWESRQLRKELIKVRQDCQHLDYPVREQVPIQFIELSEYDNYSFQPD